MSISGFRRSSTLTGITAPERKFKPYGETVRQRLRAYFTRPGWCDGQVSTYYGPQSAPEFMERTTWHTAQHLRQIYWFLDEMRVAKDAPLTDADLEGLPFPKEVWS